MGSDLLDILGLEAPILQAPIGGAATVALAAAVAESGGMGSLALTWTDPDAAVERVRQLKQRAGRRFFVNFVLRFPPVALAAVLEEGVPAVTLSWGIDRRIIAEIKARNALVGVQIGNGDGARAAREAGADFIIAQGYEAGGHVQSSQPLTRLLPAVLEAAGPLPVIAAGGIATGRRIAELRSQGAAATMLGTRFLATQEADAHAAYKHRLVEAAAESTVYTNCFDLGWPYAMVRVLRNSTFEAWEAAGCPAAPLRPGEGDVVARQSDGPIIRYSDMPPSADAVGDPLAACLYAGTGVDDIDDLPTTGELMARLRREARQT